MIHFNPASADGRLLAELKDAGVLSPDIIEQIYAAMGRPENGTLDEFLQAGADFIRENDWLSWLIRRHGCHRFGRAIRHETATLWEECGLPADGNFPYRRCGTGHVLVAVSRPDRFEGTQRRVKGFRPLWAAATLREILDLRAGQKRCVPFDALPYLRTISR